MSQLVMLNNIAHKDLRVINRFGAEFGDNVGTVPVYPTEYIDVHGEYPIFFREDATTGEYSSVALLGFDRNENLYLNEGRWDAHYIPGIVARGPFLIGFQDQEVDGETRREPVVHVDLDHPRISKTEGETVFLPQGGNSPYLERVSLVLRGIRDGLAMSKAMFAAYTALDLIEPVKLEIKPTSDESYSVIGMHTINQQKLAELDGATLEKLNRNGLLYGAFLVIASTNNVRKLIAMKQARRARGNVRH
jgi:hypothetical protein